MNELAKKGSNKYFVVMGYMRFRDHSMPEHRWVVIWVREPNNHQTSIS